MTAVNGPLRRPDCSRPWCICAGRNPSNDSGYALEVVNLDGCLDSAVVYSESRVESEDGHKAIPWVTEGVKGSRKACESSFSKRTIASVLLGK